MLEHRDLPLLAVFATVVRRGSFTAAAEELGLAKSVVSEQVRLLEERCGVRLLERTTRRLRMTQAGESLFGSADKLLVELEHARQALDEQQNVPSGTLRVVSTLELGARFVDPVLAELLAAHPQLRVEHYSDDKEVDLVGLGIDVAVRLGVLKDSSFQARRLAEDEEIVVAAPALAARWAHVRKPHDLADAPWIVHLSLAKSVQQSYNGPGGAKDEFARGEPRALVSNAKGIRTLVSAGAGFAAIPTHLIADELASGQVIQVLPGWYRRKVGIYILRPSRKHSPLRTELFVEAITRMLQRSELLRS